MPGATNGRQGIRFHSDDIATINTFAVLNLLLPLPLTLWKITSHQTNILYETSFAYGCPVRLHFVICRHGQRTRRMAKDIERFRWQYHQDL
jgi:hypothetical protein